VALYRQRNFETAHKEQRAVDLRNAAQAIRNDVARIKPLRIAWIDGSRYIRSRR
jgi:hypothetical protein